MTRLTLVLATLLAIVGFSAQPKGDLKKADKLFDKQLYNEALQEYLNVVQTDAGENRLRALFRAVESESLLTRYGDAATRLFEEPIPEDTLWKIRFLLLRAETSRLFINQYGSASPEESEAGTGDVTRKTQTEWRQEVRKNFEALIALKSAALNRSLRDEEFALDVDKKDLELIPTYWDFIVHRWTDYLLSEKSETNVAPEPFLESSYPTKIDVKAPTAQLAGSLFEDAASAGGSKRELARENWKLKRVLIPFQFRRHVMPFSDVKKSEEATVERLQALMIAFSQPRTKAEAGFETANRLNLMTRYEEAVTLCRKIEKSWPKTPSALPAQRLRINIMHPQLLIQSRAVAAPGKGGLRIRVRNVPKAYFRIYELTVEEAERWTKRYNPGDWGSLRNIPTEGILQKMNSSKPIQQWQESLTYPKKFAWNEPLLKVPPIQTGLYLSVASSEESFPFEKSLISAAVFNVTELMLFATTGIENNPGITPPKTQLFPKGFHIYSLNALSGAPESDVKLDAHWRLDYRNNQRKSAVSDKNGMASFPVSISKQDRSTWTDPLATKGDSHAFLLYGLYFSYSFPQRLDVLVETDRAIYRPKQVTKIKATVLEKLTEGFRVYSGDSPVTISATDNNGQEFFTKKLTLNDMGSASIDVEIPTGRLLGHYNISAIVKDKNESFEGNAQFQVEEYKRPEFEVTLKETEEAWRYDQKAVVEGEAKYYFGGSVPNAPVTFRVSRETYIPWICWFWRWRHYSAQKKEVASGTTTTDADGKFKFEFTPKKEVSAFPEVEPLPSRFTIEVDSRDTGGRTIQASRTYVAGAKAYLFDIKPRASFLKSGVTEEIDLRVVNLNEKTLAAKGKYELYRLGAPKPLKKKQPLEESVEEGVEDDVESKAEGNAFVTGHVEAPSLEALYSETENGAKVLEGEFTTNNKDKTAKLRITPLGVSAYRLVVKADDPWGGKVEQSIVLLGVDATSEKSDLVLPNVALSEQPSYVVGETATFLVGSSDLQKIFVEYWKGPYLKKQLVLDGGIRRIQIPITDEWRGGATVRWFGAKQFRPRYGQVSVSVPWKDKDLSVSMEIEKAVKPGAPVSWKLKAKDSEGKAIDGEATVRVYDRSLDYYAKAQGPWVDGLYSSTSEPLQSQDPLLMSTGTNLYVTQSLLLKAFGIDDKELLPIRPPLAPGFRSSQSQLHGYFGGRAARYALQAAPMAEGVAAEMDRESRPKEKKASNMADGSAPLSRSRGKDKSYDDAAGGGAAPDIAPRTNFAETAYFGPQVRLKSGVGDVAFSMPDQLTSWTMNASVITKDVKKGTTTSQFVTRKDLMLRVEIPRFFREKDKGVIKAVVHNETESTLSGAVTLQLNEGDKSVLKEFGITSPELNFQAKAHGISTLSWTVDVPARITFLKARAIARAGQLADAEERELPILPSRERIVSSQVVSFDGNQKKTLSMPALEVGDTVESAILQIDPQLILPVLNTIPFLVRYPFECTEQLINRYVPLAVVGEMFKKYPSIADAVRKIPPRKTITPEWDRTDPRRLLTLMESPWEVASKGRTTSHDLINLLKPDSVSRERNSALSSLRTRQLPDGSFPWFTGGRGDFYITLYVLESLAEANDFGVEIPEDVARKAYGFIVDKLPSHLKDSTNDVSFSLYAAFVLSAYWEDYSWAKVSKDATKKAVDFADQYSRAMTPIGKAYAANIYFRLGEKQKAGLYLDRAMDGSREDEITGVYWAPEKLSWLWYNDSIDKHSLLIRTLVEMRPDDKRLEGMVKWLLFNRKGNEWKSTKASAGAVYAILAFMKRRGALDKPEKFNVTWGDTKEKMKFEPTDWYEKAPRIIKRGNEVSLVKDKSATIEKEGPGIAFASLTTTFSTDRMLTASEGGLIEVQRKFFHRIKQGEEYTLHPIGSQGTVHVGDQIVVQLTVKTKSQFEYVHVKVPKGAGFEAEELVSGWRWEKLTYYQEPRDSLMNFFIDWLPHGEYIMQYRLRATTPGTFRIGPAVLQSMYAPEMNAYSDGVVLNVKD